MPHPAIGSARRMQVAEPASQHRVMIEVLPCPHPQRPGATNDSLYGGGGGGGGGDRRWRTTCLR